MTGFSDSFRLDGRTALVVGAAHGIGAVSALGLADFGASVVCADIDLEAAEKTAAAITEHAGTARAAAIDVRDPDSVTSVLEQTGVPDVLVHTPAINVRKAMVDYSLEEFERVVDLNLKGTFVLAQKVGQAMAARGSGSIIAFSSIRARVIEPGQSVYAGTKAGVVQMLRTLAAELGPSGVRVNAIAPGVVETDLTAQIRADQEWNAAYADKSMLRRWAKPEEFVGPVVFLASDASSFVTGSHLMVDGGWTAVDGRFTPPL